MTSAASYFPTSQFPGHSTALPIHAPRPSRPRQCFAAILDWVGDVDGTQLEIYSNEGVSAMRQYVEHQPTRYERNDRPSRRIAGTKRDHAVASPWPPFKAPRLLIPEQDITTTLQMTSQTVNPHFLTHRPSVLLPIGSERGSRQHGAASTRIRHEASTSVLVPVAPFDMDADDEIDASEVLRWVEAMERAHLARLLSILLDGHGASEQGTFNQREHGVWSIEMGKPKENSGRIAQVASSVAGGRDRGRWYVECGG
ncbi:hypothetical protein GY45DRAFT_1367946 [Cubamyces sp. BRFM 1775]|nr:hypothetical protein GY45DRAFT_1367946 [Cubamyces sp. BRFM 1775]